MRKLILYITALALSLVAVAQSNDMRKIFLDMPEEVLPALTKEMREELISNFDKKQKGEVTSPVRNHFYGNSDIKKLTDAHIEVQLDTQTALQMRKLSKGRKKYYIGLILTSQVTPEQSVLVLYNQEWKRIEEGKYFQPPRLADFMNDPSILDLNHTKKILGSIGTFSYRYSWVDGADLLRVEITSFEEPTNQSLYPDAPKWLKPGGVLYKWHFGQLRKER